MFSLSGRRALVTGGGRGLGFGIVEGFLAAGAQVAVIDRPGSLADVDRLSAAGARIASVAADLADREQLQAGFDAALASLGGELDILVNNAGVWDDTPSITMPLATWDRIIEVNLTAAFALSRRAAEVMLPRGWGRIINIGSIRSLRGGMNAAAYAASKGAIALLTQTLSNEWAPSGLRVNAIAPGAMITPLTEKLRSNPAAVADFLKRIPAGRWGRPEDVAGLAVFLASDAADYVTGAIIPCDGGFLAA
ncbi:SDR family NAD(P)-dependent oxidoreductase [Xanthobacter sediminis]|uniref:SDR family NAD(P)-dependent oxidoreductase n=1 Tax=Xanthobacter sediminis TaxID=3119926 RepID=UPI00372A5B6B